MPDTVVVVVIAAVVGPVLLFVLNRLFGPDVSKNWQEWSAEQGRRIDNLESRVKSLEDELSEERRKNRRYKSIVSALVPWALALRDEVIRAGGRIPVAPPEVEEALTTLEL